MRTFTRTVTIKTGGDDFGRGAVDTPRTVTRKIAGGRFVQTFEGDRCLTQDGTYPTAKEDEFVREMLANGWSEVL